MRPAVTVLALLVLVPAGRGPLNAQGAKQVKVTFDFRQASTQSRDAVQGGGRVIITERGAARPSGRVGVESTERRVTQRTGMFTLVQDGGESTLLVASQVPYAQVTYYRDYLTGAGYLATGVRFRDVGTSLKVRATVLSGNQVKVRVTPTISWFATDRSGVTEVAGASTELIVPNGRPVVMGGSATTLNELTRRMLGLEVSRGGSETLMTLTATVLE
jgi:type II/III secretion system protein